MRARRARRGRPLARRGDEFIAPIVTHEELLERDGGPSVLVAWNAGDDSGHHAFEDRGIAEVHESSMIEQAEFERVAAERQLWSV